MTIIDFEYTHPADRGEDNMADLLNFLCSLPHAKITKMHDSHGEELWVVYETNDDSVPTKEDIDHCYNTW